MSRSVSRDSVGELRRFRRLVDVTILATFVLVLIGGTVRVSDSGLGCGPEGAGLSGWPLCDGGVLPVANATSVIEFSHRIAATIVGLLILGLIVLAFRRLREHRWLTWGSVATGVLVLAQAGLGGITVETGLEEVAVAAHLGLAMLLLGFLLVLRHASSSRQASDTTATAQPDAATAPRRLRAVSALAGVLVLCTIVAGGLVAGTEGHGTPQQPAAGAHTACGEQFPTCLGEFMPFGMARLIDIQLAHRAFMYLTVLAVAAMLVMALVARVPRRRPFLVSGGILAGQVLLGAANVWLGKHAGLIIGHLMLGTLLWTSVTYALLTLYPVPEPSGARRLRRAGAPRREATA